MRCETAKNQTYFALAYEAAVGKWIMRVDETLVKMGDRVLVWAYGIKRVGTVIAVDGVRAIVKYTSSAGKEKLTVRHQRELKVIARA